MSDNISTQTLQGLTTTLSDGVRLITTWSEDAQGRVIAATDVTVSPYSNFIENAAPVEPDLTAPVITAPGTITGTPEAGQVLAVTGFAATGNPEPVLSYQWQRNGAAIPGAAGATYTVTEADAGADVRRQTTVTNSEGSASAVTPAVTVAELPGPEPVTGVWAWTDDAVMTWTDDQPIALEAA